MPNLVYVAPFRSVAAALVLVIFFGPIGLFYSSFLGGIIMTAFALAGLGTMATMHSVLPMATVWLISTVWAMITVRFYNHRMLKKLWAHENKCEYSQCEHKHGIDKKTADHKKHEKKGKKDKKDKKAKKNKHDQKEGSSSTENANANDNDNESDEGSKETPVYTYPLNGEEKSTSVDGDQESDVKPQWKL